MFLPIDMIDAQIIDRHDGSVEIHGQSGYIVLKPKYAEAVKTKYHEFLKAYPGKDSLKIALNIEIPQSMGQQVNER
jgi:hypothetical protein